MITVLVADDHAMVREGLRALLSSMEGYELVGSASTGANAIRDAVLLKPDLLVLDIGFPDLSGIEVVRRLAKAAPSVKILMLTMYDDDESILGAVRAGALG
jgi:DNA-binding NarL/FixJ family response regulator